MLENTEVSPCKKRGLSPQKHSDSHAQIKGSHRNKRRNSYKTKEILTQPKAHEFPEAYQRHNGTPRDVTRLPEASQTLPCDATEQLSTPVRRVKWTLCKHNATLSDDTKGPLETQRNSCSIRLPLYAGGLSKATVRGNQDAGAVIQLPRRLDLVPSHLRLHGGAQYNDGGSKPVTWVSRLQPLKP